MKRWKRCLVSWMLVMSVFLYQGIEAIPERLTMFLGEEHTIHTASAISLLVDAGEAVHIERKRSWNGEVVSVRPERAENFDCTVSVLGIPLKSVCVNVAENRTVMVAGNAVGVKIHASGLMMVGFEDIASSCPAIEAGLHIGDVMIEADGEKIQNTVHFARQIEQAEGKPMTIKVRRDGVEQEIVLTPVKDNDGIYRIGAWVRDSIAGVGTLTFYEQEDGSFASLGHSISDYDTGEMVAVDNGSIVMASIDSVEKGTAGKAGELRGRFTGEEDLGIIENNQEYGVFGKLYRPQELGGEEVPIGLKTQIYVGDVTIRTTIDGTEPKEYRARIDQILSLKGNRNMVIRITDPRLLEKTGGIVQGMSGSPILQDGKLVGAITHVFVDDPACGYAISVENMLEG